MQAARTLGPFPKGSHTNITTQMAAKGNNRKARHRGIREIYRKKDLFLLLSLELHPQKHSLSLMFSLCDKMDSEFGDLTRGRSAYGMESRLSFINCQREVILLLSQEGSLIQIRTSQVLNSSFHQIKIKILYS